MSAGSVERTSNSRPASRRVTSAAARTPATTPPPASASACPQDEADHRARIGAERDPDPDLARALADHEGHHAVDADRREHERRGSQRRRAAAVEKRRDAVASRPISSIVRTPIGRLIGIDRAHLDRPAGPRASADPPAVFSASDSWQARRLFHAGGRAADAAGLPAVRVRTSFTTPTTVIHGFFVACGPPKCTRASRPGSCPGQPWRASRVGDDDDRQRLAVVLLCEGPAAEQADAHQLEIARPIAVLCCAVGILDRSSVSVPSDGERPSCLRAPSNGSTRRPPRRRGHAGQRPRAPQDLLERRDARAG